MPANEDRAPRPLDAPRRLTAREREVLGSIVLDYIGSGVPVGSRAVSKTNSEGLSPATIRSIMADLEEAGFITHPHTSAGRIPTDLGYRYYLDSMAAPPRLSKHEQAAIAADLYAAGGLDSLLSRCCHLLAVASHQVAVGTVPDQRAATYRHVEFIKLNDSRLLVLFITDSGHVQQHVIETRVRESQAELSRHARFLNAELEGRTLAQVRDRISQLAREERMAYDLLARRAVEIGAHYFALDSRAGDLVVDGTERLLERPDLTEFDRMKSLVAALEDKTRILRILNSCVDKVGVVTSIGSETQAPELAGCAVVAASYRVDATRGGTLGIIGPTRMDYDRAIALVGYVAELLGSAMTSSKS